MKWLLFILFEVIPSQIKWFFSKDKSRVKDIGDGSRPLEIKCTTVAIEDSMKKRIEAEFCLTPKMLEGIRFSVVTPDEKSLERIKSRL